MKDLYDVFETIKEMPMAHLVLRGGNKTSIKINQNDDRIDLFFVGFRALAVPLRSLEPGFVGSWLAVRQT